MISQDLLFGRQWQMNPEVSMFSTDFAPGKETRLYQKIDGGYELTVRGVHNGQEYSWHYRALYDGQPHPVEGRDDVDQHPLLSS